MKLDVPNSVLGFDAFADFYRYPAARTTPTPLILWIGGAISSMDYESRRTTEPVAILTEFHAARLHLEEPPCDFLVLSSPPTLQGRESALDLFAHHLAFELFPLLRFPHPTGLGLVGNSYGAYLATGFACRRPDARCLVTLAGVGLWSAIVESGGEIRDDLALRCFANEEDFAAAYAHELETELATRRRPLELIERPGDHAFADYAENDSVREAFEFVLRKLLD